MTIPTYSRDIPYLTTEQMIEVDRAMIEDYKIELIQMMENAGRNLAHLARVRFLDGNPKVRPLFPDVRAAEQAYYRKTGVFPIMHVVAIRTDLIKKYPWLPKAVFEMYSKAKQRTYANLETTTVLRTTLPWVTQEFEDTRKIMGKNFWPYGIEANRKELDLVMRYTHEQGLVKRRVKFEELFEPSTLKLKEGTA